VPAKLPSFRSWLDLRCGHAPERPFLVFRDRSWTYGDLERLTDALAGVLRARGVEPGDRVAIRLPNGPQAIFSWLALAKLGAVVAPLHGQWTADEVERALALLRPKLVLDDPGSPLLAPLESEAVKEFPPVAETDADAPAELLFTSGTTGLPKAAIQTFRAAVLTGEGFASWLRLTTDDRLFTCLPLAHINARFYSTLGAIAAGATLIVEERFRASLFWRWIVESEATVANAIGAMLRILLAAPPSELDRAHRLRLVYSAPALGETDHRAFEERFGVRLVVGYGMTECTFGTIHPLEPPLDSPGRHLDSMGRPRRHPDPEWASELRVIDLATVDDREPLDAPAGAPGEIWMRGPTVFAGYFENEAATANVLRPDGWLRSGDLATRDAAGYLTFVGRTREMIRRRGENLSPLEVEQVLESHPSVGEAAVVGAPSELGEEEVAAFLVPRPGVAVEPDEVAAWCAERLAKFKVPTIWRVVDALPRTSTNRVAKAELRRWLEGEALE